MITLKILHEGKFQKQISSRVHEGIVIEQLTRYKGLVDEIQYSGELTEGAREVMQRVAKKVVPAALAAGMAMGTHGAMAQNNPHYPGLNKSIGQHVSDIFSPNYNEIQRQRQYERQTQQREWDAKQNEIRQARVRDARNSGRDATGQPRGNVKVYDQARRSADGKYFLLYDMDDRITRIPVNGTEYMEADSQRLPHYIAPNGSVYYVRSPAANAQPTEQMVADGLGATPMIPASGTGAEKRAGGAAVAGVGSTGSVGVAPKTTPAAAIAAAGINPLDADDEVISNPDGTTNLSIKNGELVIDKPGVNEAKGLAKKVKVVKGEHASKTGYIRQIKHGAFKGAPKTYYIDLEDGTQANNIPASSLRLVKDAPVTEGGTSNDLQAILDQYSESYADFKEGGDLTDNDAFFQALFDYFSNSGDMPYGVAKARDGDPVQWITDRLDDLSGMGDKVAESDPSGLMHAAKTMNNEWRITAMMDDGKVKKFRVRTQSARTAQEKFKKIHATAQIQNVERIAESQIEGTAPVNEFYDSSIDRNDDSYGPDDLHLYINVAKKLDMKKYKTETAHTLISKKMAGLVATVDDDKVTYAYQTAQKEQGLPHLLGEADLAFDADDTLYTLTDTYRDIMSSDAYDTDNKQQIGLLYDMLRDPLMAGDEDEYYKVHAYLHAKYPDAMDELLRAADHLAQGPLSENPLSPTTRFRSIHGNYCGTGNRGGMPTDKLDRACFHHDVGYKKSRELPDKDAALAARVIADTRFMDRVNKIQHDKSYSASVRFKARIFGNYFKIKNRNAVPVGVIEGTHDYAKQFTSMMDKIKSKKMVTDRSTGVEYDPEEEFLKLLQQHKAQFQGMAAIEKAQKRGVAESLNKDRYDQEPIDQLDDQISDILLRAYEKHDNRDDVIAAAWPAAKQAAQELSIDPTGKSFHTVWKLAIGSDAEYADENPAMADTTKRLQDPNDGKTAKLRASGDKKRDGHQSQSYGYVQDIPDIDADDVLAISSAMKPVFEAQTRVGKIIKSVFGTK